LDEIEAWILKPPQVQENTNDFNYNIIDTDTKRLHTIREDNGTQSTPQQNLLQLIMEKQGVLLGGVTTESIKGFEAYPGYEHLHRLAVHGVQPYVESSFECNKALTDEERLQYKKFKQQIHHELYKMQEKGRCLLLPRSEIQGTEGLHVSAIHVVCKPGDDKPRVTTDANASGLNAATNMLEIEEMLGDFTLPNIRYLAGMLQRARRTGRRLLYKSDVSSAFLRLRLAPETAMLHAVQVGNFVLIPLVMMFGWVAAPIFYAVVSGCVNWAHNGARDDNGEWVPGLTATQLDRWRVQQGSLPAERPPDQQMVDRSMTYVDDTAGPSSYTAIESDMADVETIIRQLMGADAINVKKTEGPLPELTITGWSCNMITGMMQPSEKALRKIFWWLFRGTTAGKNEKEFKITLANLRKVVGLLRWYSAVMPYASTFALQGLLTLQEQIAVGSSKAYQRLVNVRKEAAKELQYWRWVFDQGLRNERAWSAPMWFLARDYEGQSMVSMWTDAASLIGGGHAVKVVPDMELPEQGHYGQFRWTAEEKSLYGVVPDQATDINVLEFVTAVIAIIQERDMLRGRIVRLNVDNTTAVAWLNKLRSSHCRGQYWVAVLTQTLLDYNITLVCYHIKGELNIVADGLSRYMQDFVQQLEQEGWTETSMPTWEWRKQIWENSTADFSKQMRSLAQILSGEEVTNI
jgi:hypothetical protein